VDGERDEQLEETLDQFIQADRPAGSRRDPAAPSFADGRYLVKRVLGKGGQKLVYLARDTRLERDVVVSILKTDLLDDRGVTRLWREARAMGQLGDHPNIVTVYDVGDDHGRPFLVSQYIEGGALSDLLQRTPGRRLPVAEALRFGKEICAALAHAHGNETIHRDLKPGNVWLTKDGTVKLGDFGLALRLDLSRVTLEGMVVGTVVYMSPEQAMGEHAEARSDLYSLGVILYEMVAGQPPFLGDHLVAVVSQHVNTPPVGPSWHNPEIPVALEELILRLLAKSPADRPASARQVLDELAAIAASGSTQSERVVPQDTRSLSRLAAGVFVGREPEIQVLRSALQDALSGHGRLVLLVGEPGSGKTRTAEQLNTYARMRNAEVLLGRCYEGEGAPAFWPWVQLMRPCVLERDSATLQSLLGQGAAAVAQVVSEVSERLPRLDRLTDLDPEQARFRLFDSITTFFKNAARTRPLVLILDDLHWADRPSLRLLEFLAREIKDARILIVGTYRDIELGRQHPLAQTLAELARHGQSERIVLRGLSERDVARFIEMTSGVAPSQKLASSVYRDTEGNPFFVNEVVKLLVAEGRLQQTEEPISWTFRIPEGVREVIGRRLDHLSEASNRVLTVASAVGREFGMDMLEPLCELSEERLLEALEEAVAARVVTEIPRAAGRYSFSHSLVRETLYEELSSSRRVRLHRRIAEAIENLHSSSIELHVAELAHHFCQAAPGGIPDKAIDYSTRAARRAASSLAYEEAAGHYERALEVLDQKQPANPAARCELLLAMGDAHKKAGNTAKAGEVFQSAAALAKTIGAPELLAMAALGYGGGLSGALGRIDQIEINLLRDARAALGEADSALSTRVLAHLSAALYYSQDQRESLSRQAVQMARRVGDPMALLTALYFRHVALILTIDLQERLGVAQEILRLAEAVGNKELMLRAWYRLILDRMELGDIPELERAIERYAEQATDLRQPRYLWLTSHFRAMRALLAGRFAEAERLSMEALSIGQRIQDPMALLLHGGAIGLIRVELGLAEEQVAPTKERIERYPMIPGNRAILAYVYSQLGLVDETREEFEKVAAKDFADQPRDGSFIVVIGSLTRVVNFLGDVRRAEMLYPLLLPYAGRNIVSGNSAMGCGSISRTLGLLAATLSRWDEAARHFEEAIRMNREMGARPFEANSQYEYAQMLLQRNQSGDREKTAGLLAEALPTARELGMQMLEERIVAMAADAGFRSTAG